MDEACVDLSCGSTCGTELLPGSGLASGNRKRKREKERENWPSQGSVHGSEELLSQPVVLAPGGEGATGVGTRGHRGSRSKDRSRDSAVGK